MSVFNLRETTIREKAVDLIFNAFFCLIMYPIVWALSLFLGKPDVSPFTLSTGQYATILAFGLWLWITFKELRDADFWQVPDKK